MGKYFLGIVLIALSLPAAGFAASSVTPNTTLPSPIPNMLGDYHTGTQSWDVIAHTDGVVASASLGVQTRPIYKVQYLLDETDTPSAGFDCYLYDSNGDTIKTDLLGGAGTNASATANTEVVPLVGGAYGVATTGKEIFLYCTGMGSGKKMTVSIFTLYK